MSVIFGIYNRDKKDIEHKFIKEIDKNLYYWQSDKDAILGLNFVTFGHRMLWNTSESKHEQLPRVIQKKNQTFVITMDARLDNRSTLAEKLTLPNRPIEQIGDSEFILAAYIKWGEACPKYLLGDFVFAIWDETKQQLFCARDHVGIKSFYYYMDDNVFIFSNDIRGLISHSLIDEKYNDRAIVMHLGGDFGFYDIQDTFYENIKKLTAATSMIVKQNEIREYIYWDIDKIIPVEYDTYAEYTQRLKELLIDAVSVRLRTDYGVASHLSGGIDSSAIAVVAAREEKKKSRPLYAFNWIETPEEAFDPEYHEWGFATLLASLENIEQKNIKLTSDFVVSMYENLDVTKDDLNDLGEYLVRDEAQKNGVRTILSGWGGDEFISYDGYAYLSGLFWKGHFLEAIKEIEKLYGGIKYKPLRMLKRIIREIFYPVFYKKMSGLYKEEKSGEDPYAFLQNTFTVFARKQSFKKIRFKPGVHNEQKALYDQGHLLQRIEGWASSAYGKKLEYSYPLLDKRIIEFALAIPEEMYARKDGHQRYFYRSAIADFLPHHIAWKSKIGEVEHCKIWINLWHEALKGWMERHKDIKENKNPYVDRLKVINRINMYFKNQQNEVEDDISNSEIITSILLLNLKNKD